MRQGAARVHGAYLAGAAGCNCRARTAAIAHKSGAQEARKAHPYPHASGLVLGVGVVGACGNQRLSTTLLYRLYAIDVRS